MLQLYPHNQKAYTAAEKMLSETGKAAIIHPTGTGKSYIAFKFCERHPEKRICWLSPSRYIFDTQLKSLKDRGVLLIIFHFYLCEALHSDKR